MNDVLPRMCGLEARRLMAVVQDLSFGQGGFAPGGNSVEEALGKQADGSMLFVVNYGAGPWVYALNPDGSFKKGFDFNAHVNPITTDFVLASSGKIYSVEQTRNDPNEFNPLPKVHRNNADGSVDKTFAITPLPLPGPYQGNTNDYFYGNGLAVDSQGRALVTNLAQYNKPNGDVDVTQLTIDRLLPNGGRDPSFGTGGRIVIGNGATKMFVGPDDKPLVLVNMPGAPAVLRRYATSGAVDASFGVNGEIVLADLPASQWVDVDFDSGGRMLVGYVPHGAGRVSVRRFTASGQPDTSFAANGVATIDDDRFDDRIAFLAIDPMGRIVGGSKGTLFRLRADGSPDTTFGANDATVETGSDYLYHSAVTDDAIYAYSRIGEDSYGFSRYIDTLTAVYDPVNRLLKVTGSPSRDTINVRPNGNGVRVLMSGVAAQDFSGVDRVVIDALDGNDLVYSSVNLPVSVNLGNGRDRLEGTAGVFNVTGGAGNDTIITADGDDIIESNEGDDSVLAGLGRDHVRNAAGSDYTDLGAGGGVFTYGDRSYGDNLPQTVVARGGANSRYSVLTGQGGDVISIVGGAIHVDAGGGAPNRISALARVAALIQTAGENETIVTGEGNDTIHNYYRRARISAGAGNDTIYSAYGRDTINGGPGDDVVIDEGGFNRVYGGDGNDSIRTGAGGDTVYGDAGSDTLRGGGGDDSIDGGTGRDLLFGSSGDDTLLGGGNNDRLYGGPGADQLFGSAGDDLLIDRADTLDPATGTDLIDGGVGADRAYIDDEDQRSNVETLLASL